MNRFTVIIALLAVLVAGCETSPSPRLTATVDTREPELTATVIPVAASTPQPTSTLLSENLLRFSRPPAGWHRHVSDTGDFALWLPNTWIAANLRAETIAQLRQQFGEVDPTLGEYMAALLQVGRWGGMKLFAYHAAPEALAAGRLTSVNALVMNLLRPVDAELLRRTTQAELAKHEHVSAVTSTLRTIHGRQAAELTYRLTTDGPQGEQILRNRQVMIPLQDRMYVITFSTPIDQYLVYTSTFELIRDSFQLLTASP